MNTILLIVLASTPSDLRPLLDAIRTVESGGNDRAVGDNGVSRGPYQIKRGYWADSRVRLPYDRLVWDRASSEQVVVAYWRRYCPKALRANDWQTLARVHNGGPAGARKAATRDYWLKVRGRLRASAGGRGGAAVPKAR